MSDKSEFKKIQKIKDKIKNIKTELIEYLKNSDPIIRLEALNALGLFYDGDIDRAILSSLNDKDELVKTEALDNIILPKNPDKVFKKIAKLLNEKSWLVQAYAIDALAYNNAKKYKTKIKKLLKKNINEELKVRVYYALYVFGEHKFLNKLLNMLSNKNYRVRCAVANYLIEICNKKNNKIIKNKLSKALKTEKTKATKSSFRLALKYCRNIYIDPYR